MKRFACGCVVLASACSALLADNTFEFDPAVKSLAVTTSSLQVKILGGAVVALRDRRTGEIFSTGASRDEIEQASVGAVCGGQPELAEVAKKVRPTVARKPSPDSPVVFRQTSPREVILIYSGLSNGPAEDELHIGLRVESDGELSFRVEMRSSDPARTAREVYLPFVKLTPPAVIMGCGTRSARGDAAFNERCMRIANNLYSPPVAVIEGARSVMGLWPEPASFGYDDLVVAHRPECDEVVPQVSIAFDAKDPGTIREPGVTRSSWWRLAALPSWMDVARRYRAHFEKRTGAKPLWQQSPAWVCAIHAVCMERPNTTDADVAEKFYADLAARFDPEKLLLFYWNGNCILLFGDHRYMPNFQYPKPQEIDVLRRHGFRWMGYHPYVLVMSPKGKDKHLEETRRRGFGVPEGYTFQPDYAGPADIEKFYDYWRPVAAGYYAPLEESPKLWTLHPGAKLTRDYLAHNFGNYCRAHQMSGAYLDILGADHAGQNLENAPSDRRIMEGRDWRRGEEAACDAMKHANPDLALMSEVNSEWTVPHTFYTWEGESHLTHPRPVRLNHPLRAACWGSYTWTRFQSEDNPDSLVLMAGLPSARLADDWSVARAKLYCDEELFHDLPPQWDADALACFRGKSGRWFQYRKMPWGCAYAEMTPTGSKVRLGRLVNHREFPVELGAARIQHWPAYRDGKPIGLNPVHTYNFLLETPQSDERFWVTELPTGVFVTAIRHAEKHSVVELGTTTSPTTAKVKIAFHANCVSASDAGHGNTGPFAAGSTAEFTAAVPGGLVFQWQECKAGGDRFVARPATSGHLRANGTPYGFWTFNSAIYNPKFALGSNAPPVQVVEIGPGLHRGWTDQWFELKEGAKPFLRFDIGYPTTADAKLKPPRPLAWSVRVNGSELWREVVKAEPAWRPREIPLATFAARKVLITLSAEELSDTNVTPTHTLTPARFGNVRITSNP
jgi:hypothetical protein